MHQALLYLGSFTPPGGDGHGISVVRRDGGGRLVVVDEVPADSPGFLALHPSLPRLYAVSGVAEGGVTTYDVGDGGALTLRAVCGSGGANPCHVAVDADGGRLAFANYGDGRVAVYRLDGDGVPAGDADVFAHEGSGPNSGQQEGPHAHFVAFHRGVLYAVDLGTDRVHRYVTGDDGRAVAHPDGPAVLRAGSGPRHLVTDGHGAWVVADELEGTVTSYIDGDEGRWGEVSRLLASTSSEQNYPSHIEISADGQFVYVANRGPDTIAVFYLERGQLSRVGEVATGGSWPRHFAIDGDQLYVANEHSHDVTVFEIRRALPEATGHRLTTPSPGCVLPAG